jgi:hypothetical protein
VRKILREILNQHKRTFDPSVFVPFSKSSDFVSRRDLIDDLLAEQDMNDDDILTIMQDILLAGSDTSVFNSTYDKLIFKGSYGFLSYRRAHK